MAQDKENLKRKREAESVGEEKETSSSKDPKQAKKEGQIAPISSETPPDLLALARQHNWPAIEKLIEQKKITPELLTAIIEEEGDDQGKNALWLLAFYRKGDIINQLLSQITSQALESAAAQGEYQGINALWLLVASQQWDIVNQLLSQITPQALESVPPRNASALWYLATYEQWDIVKSLLSKVTSTALEETIKQGPNQGTNVLWFLARAQRWDIIHPLLDRQVTPQTLESIPPCDASALWFFARYQRWDIINQLLGQITPQALESAPMQGADQGINALWFFARYQQWNSIKSLLSKITTQALEKTAKQGVNQGTNALWFFATNQQWDVIKTLAAQKKISTGALLSRSSEGGIHARINVLMQLAISNQWEVIEKLVPKINTQLLLEESTPGTSFLNRLLDQEPARRIKFLKLLLDTSLNPLNPLALVPWEKFKTKTNAVMAALLQEGLQKNDLAMFEYLAKLGIKLPSPQENKQVADLRKNLVVTQDAALFRKIGEIYKQYDLPPEDKKAERSASSSISSDSQWTSSITDFHPDAQTAFWHNKALEAMQAQAETFGYVISEMKDRAADTSVWGTLQGVPDEIVDLIQFYTSGEHDGVSYLFDNDAFAFTQAEQTEKSEEEEEEEIKETKETKKEVADTENEIELATRKTVKRIIKIPSHQAFFKEHQTKGEELYKATMAAAKVGQFAVKSETEMVTTSPKAEKKAEEEVAPVASSETENSSSSSGSSSTLQMDTSK
jgi:hypothetical protein